MICDPLFKMPSDRIFHLLYSAKNLLTFQLLNREIIIIRQFHMKKKQKNIGFVGRKSVKKDVKVVEHALDIDEESSVYLS